MHIKRFTQTFLAVFKDSFTITAVPQWSAPVWNKVLNFSSLISVFGLVVLFSVSGIILSFQIDSMKKTLAEKEQYYESIFSSLQHIEDITPSMFSNYDTDADYVDFAEDKLSFASVVPISSKHSRSLRSYSDGLYKMHIQDFTDYAIRSFQKLNLYIEALKDFFQHFPSSFPLGTSRYVRSSPFGYRYHPILKAWKLHAGIDLHALPGTPILATADGVVQFTGWRGGYGNAVYIKHLYGVISLYGHLLRVAPGIYPNKEVKKGDVIGYLGSSGQSTGYHLHYELRLNSVPFDSEPYLFLNKFF